jgi:hypothetical protein
MKIKSICFVVVVVVVVDKKKEGKKVRTCQQCHVI